MQDMSDLRVAFQRELFSIRSDLPNLLRAEVDRAVVPSCNKNTQATHVSNFGNHNIQRQSGQNVANSIMSQAPEFQATSFSVNAQP